MKEKEKVDVLKVQAAGKCIKQGIITACKIAGQEPVLHYTALAMEVSNYLATWAGTFGVERQKVIDEFYNALKDDAKNERREGN